MGVSQSSSLSDSPMDLQRLSIDVCDAIGIAATDPRLARTERAFSVSPASGVLAFASVVSSVLWAHVDDWVDLAVVDEAKLSSAMSTLQHASVVAGIPLLEESPTASLRASQVEGKDSFADDLGELLDKSQELRPAIASLEGVKEVLVTDGSLAAAVTPTMARNFRLLRARVRQHIRRSLQQRCRSHFSRAKLESAAAATAVASASFSGGSRSRAVTDRATVSPGSSVTSRVLGTRSNVPSIPGRAGGDRGRPPSRSFASLRLDVSEAGATETAVLRRGWLLVEGPSDAWHLRYVELQVSRSAEQLRAALVVHSNLPSSQSHGKQDGPLLTVDISHAVGVRDGPPLAADGLAPLPETMRAASPAAKIKFWRSADSSDSIEDMDAPLHGESDAAAFALLTPLEKQLRDALRTISPADVGRWEQHDILGNGDTPADADPSFFVEHEVYAPGIIIEGGGRGGGDGSSGRARRAPSPPPVDVAAAIASIPPEATECWDPIDITGNTPSPRDAEGLLQPHDKTGARRPTLDASAAPATPSAASLPSSSPSSSPASSMSTIMVDVVDEARSRVHRFCALSVAEHAEWVGALRGAVAKVREQRTEAARSGRQNGPSSAWQSKTTLLTQLRRDAGLMEEAKDESPAIAAQVMGIEGVTEELSRVLQVAAHAVSPLYGVKSLSAAVLEREVVQELPWLKRVDFEVGTEGRFAFVDTELTAADTVSLIKLCFQLERFNLLLIRHGSEPSALLRKVQDLAAQAYISRVEAFALAWFQRSIKAHEELLPSSLNGAGGREQRVRSTRIRRSSAPSQSQLLRTLRGIANIVASSTIVANSVRTPSMRVPEEQRTRLEADRSALLTFVGKRPCTGLRDTWVYLCESELAVTKQCLPVSQLPDILASCLSQLVAAHRGRMRIMRRDWHSIPLELLCAMVNDSINLAADILSLARTCRPALHARIELRVGPNDFDEGLRASGEAVFGVEEVPEAPEPAVEESGGERGSTEVNPGIRYRGYLHKGPSERRFLPYAGNWRRRYIVIFQSAFLYFRNEEDFMNGSAALHEAPISLQDYAIKENGEDGFTLQPTQEGRKQRVWDFRYDASDGDGSSGGPTKDKWLRAFISAAMTANGRSSAEVQARLMQVDSSMSGMLSQGGSTEMVYMMNPAQRALPRRMSKKPSEVSARLRSSKEFGSSRPTLRLGDAFERVTKEVILGDAAAVAGLISRHIIAELRDPLLTLFTAEWLENTLTEASGRSTDGAGSSVSAVLVATIEDFFFHEVEGLCEWLPTEVVGAVLRETIGFCISVYLTRLLFDVDEKRRFPEAFDGSKLTPIADDMPGDVLPVRSAPIEWLREDLSTHIQEGNLPVLVSEAIAYDVAMLFDLAERCDASCPDPAPVQVVNLTKYLSPLLEAGVGVSDVLAAAEDTVAFREATESGRFHECFGPLSGEAIVAAMHLRGGGLSPQHLNHWRRSLDELEVSRESARLKPHPEVQDMLHVLPGRYLVEDVERSVLNAAESPELRKLRKRIWTGISAKEPTVTGHVWASLSDVSFASAGETQRLRIDAQRVKDWKHRIDAAERSLPPDALPSVSPAVERGILETAQRLAAADIHRTVLKYH